MCPSCLAYPACLSSLPIQLAYPACLPSLPVPPCDGFCCRAAFLNMLCTLKWGIYIFFGFWQFVAIFFVYFLVPETRGVPIEEVTFNLTMHWLCLVSPLCARRFSQAFLGKKLLRH